MNDIRGLSLNNIVIDDYMEIDNITFQIIINGFSPIIENPNIDKEEEE